MTKHVDLMLSGAKPDSTGYAAAEISAALGCQS